MSRWNYIELTSKIFIKLSNLQQLYSCCVTRDSWKEFQLNIRRSSGKEMRKQHWSWLCWRKWSKQDTQWVLTSFLPLLWRHLCCTSRDASLPEIQWFPAFYISYKNKMVHMWMFLFKYAYFQVFLLTGVAFLPSQRASHPCRVCVVQASSVPYGWALPNWLSLNFPGQELLLWSQYFCALW